MKSYSPPKERYLFAVRGVITDLNNRSVPFYVEINNYETDNPADFIQAYHHALKACEMTKTPATMRGELRKESLTNWGSKEGPEKYCIVARGVKPDDLRVGSKYYKMNVTTGSQRNLGFLK